jgi:hypothetical protein
LLRSGSDLGVYIYRDKEVVGVFAFSCAASVALTDRAACESCTAQYDAEGKDMRTLTKKELPNYALLPCPT